MLPDDYLGMGLYFGYLVAFGLPAILAKLRFKLSLEVIRKIYHLIITLSIYPLVLFFKTWYMAVLAVILLVVIAYPLLARVENSSFYRRIAAERNSGEFKRSLVIVQGMIALLIVVFWGILGSEWKYVAVVSVMAWGLGDAAAALIGKKFGRRPIRHPGIAGRKTIEGTQAMYITATIAVFFTLIIYAGQPWHVSLPVALLVAPLCAIIELFSNHGLDTVTVPISTATAVLIWMSIFTYLGG